MAESVASSKTLSTQCEIPKTMPYDLVDIILGHTIGQIIHGTLEAGHPLGWTFIADLAGVSTNFRAIVLKMVALAFRIPLPCGSQSIFLEGYKNLRSLLLFRAATFAGAVLDPPVAWQSPLMLAYGYYFKATRLAPGQHHFSVLGLRSRKSEITLALCLCNGTVAGLSRALVDALHSALAEEPDS